MQAGPWTYFLYVIAGITGCLFVYWTVRMNKRIAIEERKRVEAEILLDNEIARIAYYNSLFESISLLDDAKLEHAMKILAANLPKTGPYSTQ